MWIWMWMCNDVWSFGWRARRDETTMRCYATQTLALLTTIPSQTCSIYRDGL
jgi:hypothetical protein